MEGKAPKASPNPAPGFTNPRAGLVPNSHCNGDWQGKGEVFGGATWVVTGKRLCKGGKGQKRIILETRVRPRGCRKSCCSGSFLELLRVKISLH